MAERESIQVYISYSRRDREFVQRLAERLKNAGINIWLDAEQIPAGSDWMKQIEQGIQSSNAYLFILSPDSLKSEMLVRELELATNTGKRIIPIVTRDVDYKEVPIELSSLNWIFMRSQDDFESSISRVLDTIYIDIEWVKEHTRLELLAADWAMNNKDSSYLLRGQNYQDAMQAVTANNGKEPFLTALQQEFLLASQQSRGLFDRFEFRNASQTSKAQANAVPLEKQAETQETEEIQPIEVGKLFSVSTDQASGTDQLNYSRFADAFVTLIKNPEAKTPITIGIYGQWGSGKSFLMKKIKELLNKDSDTKSSWAARLLNSFRRLFEPKTEKQVDTIVIEFNAWVYSGSEHLWASLVTHLYREVEKHIGIRTHFYRLWKAVRRLFPKAVGVFLFYAIPALVISLLTDFTNIQTTWEAMNTAGQAVSVSVVGGSLLATLPILWSALREFGDTVFMSQAANLQKLASKPDFRDQIGIMADIKAEIGFISQLLESRNKNRQTRVVLFIDDLDRCEHRKAVEVLQAVMLLLADRDGSPFVVFLGIDARVIVRAIEENYGSVLVKAGINGYEYLDKIVQMPFVIPFANRRDIGNYIDSLIWSKEEKEQVEAKFPKEEMDLDTDERIPDVKKDEVPVEPTKPASTPTEKPVSQTRTEAVPVTFTKPEREALKRCVDDIIENPRKIKRIVNIYRFVRLLFPPNFHEHEKIIRWILLTEQWPLHAAWILEEIESDYDLKGEFSKNQNATILDVYKRVKENLYSDEMDELMTIDADPVAFNQFIQKDPIFTVHEIYYNLYKLTFNLNPAVRSEITKYKARIAENYIKDQQ